MTIAKRAGGTLPAGAERRLRTGAPAVDLAAPLIPGRWCSVELDRHEHAGEEGSKKLHQAEHNLSNGAHKEKRRNLFAKITAFRLLIR